MVVPLGIDKRGCLALIHPLAMEFILVPMTFIEPTIRPEIFPITLFEVIYIPSFILTIVRPSHQSSTIHFAFFPLSYIYSTITPPVFPLSTYLVVLEVT